jgi:uncharacterized membrane protein YbaN (DUF454 family)
MALRLIWAGAGLFCLFLAALGVLLPFWPAPPFAVLAALCLTATWPALRQPLLRWPFFQRLFRRWDRSAGAPPGLRLRTAFALSLAALLEAMHAVSQGLRRWVRRRR